MSIIAKRASVLRLYKDLLRYAGQLQYTDKDYFAHRVRDEFRRNRSLETAKDIEFYYNKGNALLTRKRIV